jgi:glutathione S-transferase
MGDIPAAVTTHRWYAMDIDRPRLPNLEQWYDRIKQRRAFRDVVTQPLS